MARGHRTLPTDALFDRSARPPLARDGRIDDLRDQFEPEDLSDRASFAVRRELLRLIDLDLEDLRVILTDPTELPRHPQPADLVDKGVMAVIPYFDLSPPFFSLSNRGSRRPDTTPQFVAARRSYIEHAKRYNELLMGSPEVFLAFEATEEENRVDRFADLVGIPRDQMRSWRDEARRHATVPARVRQDPTRRGQWLARWHSRRLTRIVPAFYRPYLQALGRVVYLTSEHRMSMPLIEDFMNGDLGEFPGSSPRRLITRDPDTWLARLPAMARAHVASAS